MNYPTILNSLLEKKPLGAEAMEQVMSAIFSGAWSSAQIAGFLVAMRLRPEDPHELAAAAQVMRRHAIKVVVDDPESLLDTCGTGGDNARLFNVSTAAALVAAAAGVRVAKHGNRAASGASGSSDLLEAFGVSLELDPSGIADCVNEIGIGFMFAPIHHAATKYAAVVRKELGIRTMFNLLGPLTNPANAGRQLLGIFDHDLLESYAQTLKLLGCRRGMVVHGSGLDELTIAGVTDFYEIKEDGTLVRGTVVPEDVGLTRAPSLDGLISDSVDQSKKLVEEALSGIPGSALDMVALNAGAAIYVAGLADNLNRGVQLALEVLKDGAAQRKIDELVSFVSDK